MATATRPGDGGLQLHRDAANSSTDAVQRQSLHANINGGATGPRTMRRGGDEAVQRAVESQAGTGLRSMMPPIQALFRGDNDGAPLQRMTVEGSPVPSKRVFLRKILELVPKPDHNDIINRVVGPAFWEMHQSDDLESYGSLANQLYHTAHAYRLATEFDTLDTFVNSQIALQSLYLGTKGAGFFKQFFTTVGLEHEFGHMPNGFLDGVSHLELAESALQMPLTGLPFYIETDAGSTLELVSPPFLLPTVDGLPIPDPDIVRRIDNMFRQELLGLLPEAALGAIQAGTAPTIAFQQMIGQLGILLGTTFQHTDLAIAPSNLYQIPRLQDLANATLDEGQSGYSSVLHLDPQIVDQMAVSRSDKSWEEDFHVSGQINFATDMKTAEPMLGDSGMDPAGAFQELEQLLIARAGVNLLPTEQTRLFGRMAVKHLASLFAVYSQQHCQTEQRDIHRTLKRNYDVAHGHTGGMMNPSPISDSGDRLRNNDFYTHMCFASFVKDTSPIWVKDHLYSIAKGLILRAEDQVYVGDMMERIADAIEGVDRSQMNHPSLGQFFNMNAHFQHFRQIAGQAARELMHKFRSTSLRTESPDVPVYGFTDRFPVGRQDTMLHPEKVQQPDLFDSRLHVAEIRRGNPADQLEELREAHRQK